MDTSNIKRFATEARNKLKAGIAAKILTLGFDRNGNVSENAMPQLMQGGTLWNGNILPEGFYHQWMSLYNRVQLHGINAVYEEAAYTWFNRLVAIRILQKNGIISPVMAYADSARTPMIVQEARQGRLPIIENELLRSNLMQLLDDDTKTAEQFALLIVAYCHQNPIIRACFGSMADYTELLLPQNILSEGGFVDMLNHTEFITDDDFHSPELIGWLYQFYNAERKDEAFAKKGKYEADDIAPATQIFTPNWIVKYMVENTVGRIYLDNNPYATEMKERWKYLVEPVESTPADTILHYDELPELRVADFSCGSGHILNECFDMLYDLYIAEGYGRREAIENIFKYNLTGIDLDLRAKQLATFALLLKACQKDSSFADAHRLPQILNIPDAYLGSEEQLRKDIREFCGGCDSEVEDELVNAIALFDHADELGSIMKFSMSDDIVEMIKGMLSFEGIDRSTECAKRLIPYFKVIYYLTLKYHAICMNPPYMPTNKTDVLAKYAKAEYPDSKSDLFAVFMEVAKNRLVENGKYGIINMQSWMFLSSYEALRKKLLDQQQIESMLHLGPRTFDELSGEVVQNTAFVISNRQPKSAGIYHRLIDGKDCSDKSAMFLNKQNKYIVSNQSQFEQIPGALFGYWISKSILQSFTMPKLGEELTTREGMATADNPRFLRYWDEISAKKFSKYNVSADKWYPYNKGGAFRKWYGNRDFVVNWSNDGYEIRNNIDVSTGRIRSHNYNGEYAFKESVTWSAISSGSPSMRYCEEGFLWDSKGASGFSKNNLKYYIGLLNSVVANEFLKLLSPTLDFKVGDIVCIPLVKNAVTQVENIVNDNILISKQDWDAHETSWDFEKNQLIAAKSLCSRNCADLDALSEEDKIGFEDTPINGNLIEHCYRSFCTYWAQQIKSLKRNEEELNRQFIKIYGLQDELSPDVPLKQITILQQGEVSIGDDDSLSFNADVIIKQFISYAVGCMMGRYRLDRPGLAIAHPDATEDEYAPYQYNGETFDIDDDAIVPLMPADSGFSDNAAQHLNEFVRIAFGDENHVANLNFIEKCLGKTVEQYFVKDFWKDHKKMYQNRPIYWLFASKKGSFQVVTYMHRMNAYTVERIRAKYLLPYIEHLQNNIAILEGKGAALSTAESRKLDSLKKVLDECREYHERLQVVAEQAIAFDLDDGVVVNHAKFGDVVTKLK